MVSGTLYTYPNNFRAYKALIAAKYSGANVKQDPDFFLVQPTKLKNSPTSFLWVKFQLMKMKMDHV